MRIHGFQKLTLLDYPGKIACTIFLGQCNFRCPFCHNANLVVSWEDEPVLEAEEVFAVLKKRQGILEGVCITGGEPTLSPELIPFLRKIKELGYLIKLDTNGYRPEILKEVVEKGLVDYIAMDIKNTPAKYRETAGISKLKLEHIQASISFLMGGSLDYEFRTTVTKELHQRKDLLEIGSWIAGAKRYFLQPYQESPGVINPAFTSYTVAELVQLKQELQVYVPTVEVRAI